MNFIKKFFSKSNKALSENILQTRQIPPQADADVIFYTYANRAYYPFAILYPLFVLNSNKNAIVEIALENANVFREMYKNIIGFYNENYPNRVYFHQLDFHNKKKVQHGTLRFITQPHWKAKYVYIGDVDIFVLEDILQSHLDNIKNNNLDFSNMKRVGIKKLTGLHFIEYDKMYPIDQEFDFTINDEMVLFRLMKEKGYKIPDESLKFRPIHGLHISFFSRPPFQTLTTNDKFCDFPTWFNDSEECQRHVQNYQNTRYTKPIVDFTKQIKDNDAELRRILQIVDATVYYFEKNMV